MRRYRTLEMDPEFLASVIGMGSRLVLVDGPVPDLRIKDIRYDHFKDRFEVLCWSSTFDEVEAGSMPPVWNPTYRIEQ